MTRSTTYRAGGTVVALGLVASLAACGGSGSDKESSSSGDVPAKVSMVLRNDVDTFDPFLSQAESGARQMFDAGRGALQRLVQLNIPWQAIQGVFFTHLHSDHVVGFPDLWLTGWLIAPGRTVPLQVWGPTGTADMISHLRQAYQYDIGVRMLEAHSGGLTSDSRSDWSDFTVLDEQRH